MTSNAHPDRDYLLGTHDEEIERLGLQHRIWRAHAAAAWKRAGFTLGQTLLDVGCGPGYATLDFAEIVGRTGRVIGVDRSRRFLDTLEHRARVRGLDNITLHELELDADAPLPAEQVDGAWARWVFAFVQKPRELLARVARTLRPGGVLVMHEYYNYEGWTLVPPNPVQQDFVKRVVDSWRATGGEPDIGASLPAWLEGAGLRLTSVRPLVDIVPPTSFVWEWPSSFVEIGAQRLVDLGRMTTEEMHTLVQAYAESAQVPGALMATPGVIEIIATRI
ncbi:MAG: hypothetical protein JWO05_1884 [Gemmatimonadetes bacterium]|nr:hypothetical protein [Gemmatimonadota bacterium]